MSHEYVIPFSLLASVFSNLKYKLSDIPLELIIHPTSHPFLTQQGSIGGPNCYLQVQFSCCCVFEHTVLWDFLIAIFVYLIKIK